MTVVLALDIGTSAVKAATVVDGRVDAVCEEPLEVATPAPGRVEQDPQDWWNATVAAVTRLSRIAPTAPEVIALTGQMQDLIPLDDHGAALGRAILYADTRASAEHEELVIRLGGGPNGPWTRAVGAESDATTLPAKWRWLVTHEPERAAATASVVVGAHGYLASRLTGRVATDPTTAATTGCLDLDRGQWWTPALENSAQRPLPMAGLIAPDVVLGSLIPEAASALALSPGLGVVVASGDVVATTLGVVGEDTASPYAYVGTSGWVAVATPEARPSPGVIVLPGLGPQHWVSTAPVLCGGASLDWVRTHLLGGLDHQRFDRLAQGACAAEVGVLWWPHLDGSRAPSPDPHATGVLIGARRSTGPEVIAAAAVEGLAQSLRAIAEVVAPGEEDLAVCGGASRSDVTAQVLADVTGRRVHRVVDEHASVRGAAACAHRALGASALAPAERLATFTPRAARHRAHRAAAEVFDGLADALRPTFSSLARLNQGAHSHPTAPADKHEGETSP